MKPAWAGCLAAALTLSACGSESAKPTAEPTAAAATGPASAEQVAAEMRGDVSCRARSSAASQDAPVSDVVGVRLGMTWDEAANAVMCDNPLLVVAETNARDYNINTYGTHIRQGFDAKFAEPRVEKTSQQIIKEMQDDAMRRGMNTYVAPLKPGQSRYFVSTMGLPGKERVISVAREEYYPEGKLPTVETIKQALIKKYGQPSQAEDNGRHAYLWWEFDPTGRRITETSPHFMPCRINVSPDSPTSLTPDCGVSIGALIQGSDANPGLAHSLAVTSQNGATGYELITSTERALLKQDGERKAKELGDASKSAAAPKL